MLDISRFPNINIFWISSIVILLSSFPSNYDFKHSNFSNIDFIQRVRIVCLYCVYTHFQWIFSENSFSFTNFIIYNKMAKKLMSILNGTLCQIYDVHTNMYSNKNYERFNKYELNIHIFIHHSFNIKFSINFSIFHQVFHSIKSI